MHLADDVEEVRVAALGEGKFLQVGVFLQKIRFGDVLRDFQSVGLDVGRNETQLADETACRFVHVCRDKQSADFMHHVIKLVQIRVKRRPQQPFLVADDFLVFIDNELVANFFLIQRDVGKVLVEKLLELVQLLVGLEIGEGMGFFLRGDFNATDDEDAVFAPDFLRHLHLSRGIVVADGDDV